MSAAVLQRPSISNTAAATPAHAAILIVIVNYRTADLTLACMASLEAELASVPGGVVVVVDNDSQDGSAERIGRTIADRGWKDWAVLERAPRNGGFAYGNNRGIEAGLARCRPGFILLLNSDTLVQPGCLRRCLEVMERDAGIGVMSCCLLNADGSVQNVARRFPTPLRLIASTMGLPFRFRRAFGHLDCEDPTWDRRSERRDVDWLGGAFLLVRTEVVRQVGGLDERFFFYGEDIEFCHRVWRQGYRVHYDPTATTLHLGGQSSDPTRMATRVRSNQTWRGRYLVQRLCYGRLAAAVVRIVDAVAMAGRCAAFALAGRRARGRLAECAADLRALFQGVGRP
jgi:N-acetylglucosaminyl-diphospho-decaprenol L-rhamnosyltransferase